MRGVFYNDFNTDSVVWLSQLIENGDISEGVVTGGDFRELNDDELREYKTVHLFAGIGGWDYALRLAGWSGPVWTASLPCQPFSPAGKGKGRDDDRHLLPDFLDLVAKCRPDTIFGEQSSGAIKHGWLDDLQTGLEAEGYAVGHCVLGAHSVGAPHIRQRLYWVAHSSSSRHKEQFSVSGISSEKNGDVSGEDINGSGRMDDTQGHRRDIQYTKNFRTASREVNTSPDASEGSMWSDCTWLQCADGKQRPIKPGVFPLANGIPGDVVQCGDTSIQVNETQEARKMRLHGYGNAIVPQVAAEFIKAFMDARQEVKCVSAR